MRPGSTLPESDFPPPPTDGDLPFHGWLYTGEVIVGKFTPNTIVNTNITVSSNVGYLVDYEVEGNGTVVMSVFSAIRPGETVNIWVISSTPYTIIPIQPPDLEITNNKFIMPASDVKFKVVISDPTTTTITETEPSTTEPTTTTTIQSQTTSTTTATTTEPTTTTSTTGQPATTTGGPATTTTQTSETSGTTGETTTTSGTPSKIIETPDKSVILDLTDATLPPGVIPSIDFGELQPDENPDGDYILIKRLISTNASLGNLQNLVLYEIKLVDQNGNPVQFDGVIKVRLKVPDGMGGDLRVFWYNEESRELVDMKAVVEGDYLVFETSHFSLYAIAQLKAATPVPPKTGADRFIPVWSTVLMIILALGSACCLKIGKKA